MDKRDHSFTWNISLRVIVTVLQDSELLSYDGDVRGVMFIVVVNEHDDSSSNPGQDWLQFTLRKYSWQRYESNYFCVQPLVNSKIDCGC